MVGGRDYQRAPFNLATQGQRQPGSAFKPFILAAALRDGIGAGSIVAVAQARVRRAQDATARRSSSSTTSRTPTPACSTLAHALTFSDNAVYAAVGIKVGTKQVARSAERMGIRTPVSTNSAMTLGGLKQGVTPLDMAHAYETFADRRPARRRLARRRRATARSASSAVERPRATARSSHATSAGARASCPSGVARDRDADHVDGRDPAAPARRAAITASSPPARPARPRTTATPGSSASPSSSRSPSGSATRTSSSR